VYRCMTSRMKKKEEEEEAIELIEHLNEQLIQA
jgi:hypothetical protein